MNGPQRECAQQLWNWFHCAIYFQCPGKSKASSPPNDLFHHAVSALASKTADPLSANGVSCHQPAGSCFSLASCSVLILTIGRLSVFILEVTCPDLGCLSHNGKLSWDKKWNTLNMFKEFTLMRVNNSSYDLNKWLVCTSNVSALHPQMANRRVVMCFSLLTLLGRLTNQADLGCFYFYSSPSRLHSKVTKDWWYFDMIEENLWI